MKGYVYTGKMNEKALMTFMGEFFGNECFNICQEIDRYEFDIGLPRKICSEGRVFSDKGEIKWEKLGDDYSVILLVEKQVPNIPPELVSNGREWTVQEKLKEVYLVNLDSSQISPKFSKYPKNAEKLKVRIYLDKNVPKFTSLRGLE